MSEEQRDFVKIGSVFSAALTILCGAIGSDWQRDEIYSALGISPLGLGFLIWPAVGYLLAGAKSDFGMSSCLSAVTFYNYWVAERLTDSGAGAPSLIERLWGGNKLGLSALVVFYVVGQIVIVLPKVRERHRTAPAI